MIRLLKRNLARETAEWVEDGVISERQAEQICDRYGVDFHRVNAQSSAYTLLLLLGYLFIGLSLITLIGANWDDIPRAVRMVGVMALTVATQAIALYRFIRGDRRGAQGGFLLGNLFYGAAIILIAQIYHLGEHMPDGILLWALGWLPTALLLRSQLLLAPCLMLAGLWFFVQSAMGFYPLWMPLFLAAGLWGLTWKKANALLLFLVTGGAIVWLEYSLGFFWNDFYRLDFFPEHAPLTAGLMVWLYALGQFLAQRPGPAVREYGDTLQVWVLRGLLLSLVIMSYRDPWNALISEPWLHQPTLWGALTVLLVSALWLVHRTGRWQVVVAASALLLTFLTAVLLVAEGQGLYFQIATNLLLVGLGAGMMVRGIHDGNSERFFLGLGAILLTAFMRYVDLIGDYIGGAMLFLVFALLMLGAARYWKRVQSRGGQS